MGRITLKDINQKYYLLKKEDLEEIQKFYISKGLQFPYIYHYFNEESENRAIVRNGEGKKPKKYNEQQIEKILKSIDDIGIRKTAAKYDSSTRLIQSIKNGTYKPRD